MIETVRREHRYQLSVTWTGNRGEGTRSYTAYSRDHEVSAEGKPALLGSSDPAIPGRPDQVEPGGAAGRRNLPVPHALVPAPLLRGGDRGDRV